MVTGRVVSKKGKRLPGVGDNFSTGQVRNVPSSARRYTAALDERSLAQSRSAQAFLLWSTWLAAAAAFFSVAGYFHLLAPGMLAITASLAIVEQRCGDALGRSARQRTAIEQQYGDTVQAASRQPRSGARRGGDLSNAGR